MRTRLRSPTPDAAREPAASASARHSPTTRVHSHGALQSQVDGSPRLVARRRQRDSIFRPPIQREASPDAEELQMKAPQEVARRQPADDEEGPLQGRFRSAPLHAPAEEEEKLPQAHASDASQAFGATPASGAAHAEAAPRNRTGMPDALKAGIESLSGLSMDHVRVHYNSAKPAQLNAHAYAQGSEIHVAPGQERHLPHEAWHVVQQAHGRVRPTAQMKTGVPVNDDRGLEAEADAMGARALHDVGTANQWVRRVAQTRSVVQRALAMVYGGGAELSPASAQKLIAVRATVNAMGLTILPEIDLNLEVTEDRDHLQINPADTTLHPPQMHQGQQFHTIDMTIRSWFIDISTVGEIIGMICHELGVHSLADLEMTAAEYANETAQAGAPSAVAIGGLNLGLAPMVLDANGQLEPADRRQKDHVNVGKFDALGAHPLQPMPHAEIYRHHASAWRCHSGCAAGSLVPHGSRQSPGAIRTVPDTAVRPRADRGNRRWRCLGRGDRRRQHRRGLQRAARPPSCAIRWRSPVDGPSARRKRYRHRPDQHAVRQGRAGPVGATRGHCTASRACGGGGRCGCGCGGATRSGSGA